MDVEQHAGRVPLGIAVEQRLGRTERPDGEAVDGQQANNAFQEPRIVIDHNYDCRRCCHIFCPDRCQVGCSRLAHSGLTAAKDIVPGINKPRNREMDRDPGKAWNYAASIPRRSAIDTASATDVTPSFVITPCLCALMVRTVVPSSCAICLLSLPLTTRAKTSASRGVKFTTSRRMA